MAAAVAVPLLVVGVGRQVFFERTVTATSRASSGATLVTMGVGMLLLGGAGVLAARRAARDGRPSRAGVVLAVLCVLWPAWLLFVQWYDHR
ncbi:hypothetical protein GCM10025868_07400 [Angustibacter aerolatus]|uniref:Uncharacterized protein n=1 Tax=Angustibacter aerolatus TaxID=1162965 RepID=A0ABQ6JE80_9ACTN|nr:hypothetical protein [Angustibacter aerolatus]GMA85490.1 hypothetical protein GCM10025868_07400 [Angustibacter aerolatus]